MSKTVDNSIGFTVIDSPTETARFQRKVKRFVLHGKDAQPMLKAIEEDSPDLAIVRIPTDRYDVLQQLHGICDDAILADCLVIYERDNTRCEPPPPPRNEGWALRTATAEDISIINKLTEIVFENYQNHYSANQQLSKFSLVDGYKEWNESFLRTPGRRCLLATIEGKVCAFATVRIEDEEGEGVLYGVSSEFQGRGVYRDLIRSTVHLFIDEGATKSIVSTQITNLPVQRVWVTEGFLLTQSYYTVHLNYAGQQ